MTQEEIISTIRRIQKDYSGCKDGGRSFVAALARKIDNALDDERDEIVDFLLREIALNANGLCSLALATAELLAVPDFARRLEVVYREQQATKDERWKRDVLMVLLKKGYQSTTYEQFLTENPTKEEKFFFLVHYANLYPQEGIALLAECLIKQLHISRFLPEDNPDSFFGVTPYLLNLVNPPAELLTPLVAKVYAEDAKSGEHLRKFVVHLLRHYPHSLPEVFVAGILSGLGKYEEG
ncbi:MAG: hypothetical protein IK000_00830 [Bacteroidaceae bacterium]|nr:hypothetical protein [Bacteroidaceae bacterium]